MKYNQNEKILQITEQTLVVGIDIGSETHYARVFNYRGLELGKLLIFRNDSEGFKKFVAWAEELKVKHAMSHIVIGMEPTGHYWFTLGQYIRKLGMRIVLVNPYHVKQSKELDDGTPSKTDRKDPKTIAMLVKDGRYIEPYIPEGIYSELRIAMENRWSIVKQQNATKNKIKRWICIYFPEFEDVFGDWEGKAALIALKEYPTPSHVLALGVEGIVASWRKQKLRAVGAKRAVKLVEAAKQSIGMKEGMVAGLNELEMLLEDYEQKLRQYEKVMALIEELAMKIPGFDKLLEIKGVGLMLAAGFVSEIGDIKRFEHPRQIQKLAGLNLKETSSGKQKGKTQISKRGRKRLRYYLNFGIMPLLSKNKEFRQLHEYYTTRDKNPLKKMQSLVALSNKLIRIFFAILTKQTAYDPQKMMNDIIRPTALQAA